MSVYTCISKAMKSLEQFGTVVYQNPNEDDFEFLLRLENTLKTFVPEQIKEITEPICKATVDYCPHTKNRYHIIGHFYLSSESWGWKWHWKCLACEHDSVL